MYIVIDGVDKGQIATEIEGFGGGHYHSYSNSQVLSHCEIQALLHSYQCAVRFYRTCTPRNQVDLVVVLMQRRVAALYNNLPVRKWPQKHVTQPN